MVDFKKYLKRNMAQLAFDASKVAPQGDRAPVPEGEYAVILTGTDVTLNGQNKQVKLTMKVLDGPIAGQMIFQNLWVGHTNPVAQQIGQERLSALCHSVGQLQIQDTAQLHGRPFRVKVGVQEEEKDNKPTGRKFNEVLAFLTPEGKSPAGSVPASGPTGGAAPAWAGAAQPTSPQPTAPQPAPQAQQPPAVPVPNTTSAPTAPAAADPFAGKMFYVAHNGANITPAPITADQVRMMPQGLAALHICEVGQSAWTPASSLTIAAPVVSQASPPVSTNTAAPAASLPPWMQTPPASA